MRVAAFLATVIAVVVSACTNGASGGAVYNDHDTGSEILIDGTATASAPVEVGDLLDGDAPREATVSGFVVWGSAGARLCEALMESFPPQCGGAAVAIANPETLSVELQEEESIRWTNDRVQLVGNFDGTLLTLGS